MTETRYTPPTDAELKHLKALGLEVVDVAVENEQYCRNCQHDTDRNKWQCQICHAYIGVNKWDMLSAFKPRNEEKP